MNRYVMGLLSALLLMCGISCSKEKVEKTTGSDETGKILAFASVAPVSFIVGKVGGNRVDARALVTKSLDPHTYSPSPQEIVMLSKAKLYFTIDLPFEKNIIVRLLVNSKVKVVNAAAGIIKRRVESGEEEHGHDHAHENSADVDEFIDTHLWLSPVNDEKMAGNICQALIAIDPSHAAEYRKNCEAFILELQDSDLRLKKALAAYKGKTFYVYHPAFGYFADHYGMKQEAIELEGKSPTPKHLEKLIKKALGEKVRIIFVQPFFDEHCARSIADAIGGKIVKLDPLAENLLQNYTIIATAMEEVFRDAGKHK